MVRLRCGRFDWTVQVGERSATSSPGECHKDDNGVLSQYIAEAKQRSTPILGLDLVGRARLLRNTDSTPITTMYSESVPTTSHHKALRAHWIIGWDQWEFITLSKKAACRLQITPATMPGASGRMDSEVVDIRETEREFQADMPPLEPLDMNMLTRANTVLIRTAKELAQGNRRRAAPRWSAAAELILFVRLAFALVGGAAEAGRHRRGRNYDISKEVYTRKKGVHAQRAFHTPCSAHKHPDRQT